MDVVVSSNWSQLGVETTTSPFSVEEAERRVRGLRPPQRLVPDLGLHLRSTQRSGDLVIRTKNLQVGYSDDLQRGMPGKLLFRAPDIELRRTDCAALIGPTARANQHFSKRSSVNSTHLLERCFSEQACTLDISRKRTKALILRKRYSMKSSR